MARRRSAIGLDLYDELGLGLPPEEPVRERAEVSMEDMARASGDPRFERAAHAKELLEDELLCGSIDVVRAQLRAAWQRSAPGPEGLDKREHLHAMLRALDDVIRVLHRVLREGQVTQAGGRSGGRPA